MADDHKRDPLDVVRAVFMISVASELAEMHPQTLRMYEARGLNRAMASKKNTRLYSQADVELLRRIQELTTREGLNLAGVEAVLEMEKAAARMREEMARVRKRAERLEERMQAELERLRSSLGGELVPYGAYEPKSIRPEGAGHGTRIRIERRRS